MNKSMDGKLLYYSIMYWVKPMSGYRGKPYRYACGNEPKYLKIWNI